MPAGWALRCVGGQFWGAEGDGGFEGKWGIHPSQIDLANRIFSPCETEVERALGILDAMEDAQRSGLGAVFYNGKMIDFVSMRQAEVVVRKADEISEKVQ